MTHELLKINLEKSTNNPIMIELGLNPIMGCFEVYMTVGNFTDEETAKRVANKLQKFAEAKLGSRNASLAKEH